MNRRLAQQFRNIETNFTKLIDQIIFFDSVDADDEAIEILQGIVNIDIDKQIDLLFEDLKYRNYAIETAEIYNVIWYSMVGEKEQADLLVKKLSVSPDKESIIAYLWYLNAGYNDGNKTEEEYDIEDVLYAVQKGEPLNNRKPMKKMIKKIELSFSDLVDRIIFYDSIDQDALSYDIIIEIEKIPTDKLINLMIKELHKRDYKISPRMMYNYMWYYLADFHDKSNMLVKEILKSANKDKITGYLWCLNQRSESDSELNVQDVIDAVNQSIKITKNKKLKKLFSNLELNFESLVEKMIHYETSKIATNLMLALDISRKLSNIEIDKQIDLLIDLTQEKSEFTKDSVFYNNLWRKILSVDSHRNLLIKKLKIIEHSDDVIAYLIIIETYKDGENCPNIKWIIDAIEQ
jgi:hypothetical protein